MIEEDQTNRLNADQKVLIKDLFSQGVKHKMKVNISRQLSRPSGRERDRRGQRPLSLMFPLFQFGPGSSASPAGQT